MPAYTYTTLDDPSATNGTFAEGINNSGQIVGYYQNATGNHGFLYSGGTYTTLDDTAANSGTTQAFGINNLGQIVGGFSDSNRDHGFLYSGGTYTTLDAGASSPGGFHPGLGDFPATGTTLYGINDSGQIVGQFSAVAVFHLLLQVYSSGFLSSTGTDFTTISPPWAGSNGNPPHAVAAGINDLNEIVGSPGFAYTFGAFTLIDDPLATSVTYGPGAYGVNDTGDIVGYYTDTSGINHSFLATPTNLNSPPPAGTTADTILRDGVTNVFGIWDIGNNSILAGGALGQVGPEWQFAGVGGFQAGDTSDMLLRNVNFGALEVYDISNNNITNATSLGTVGLDWQVAGFGNFSSVGETDMIMRNGSAFEVYDIQNNQITDALPLGDIGTEWQIAGFDNHGSETDMVLRNTNTGALEIYDINNNQISSASLLGVVGLEWQVVGFGNFSSRPGEGDMIMENTNTGALEVYDISNNRITSANTLGNIGEYQIVGFGPLSSSPARDRSGDRARRAGRF